jgi:hypothetical protein
MIMVPCRFSLRQSICGNRLHDVHVAGKWAAKP